MSVFDKVKEEAERIQIYNMNRPCNEKMGKLSKRYYSFEFLINMLRNNMRDGKVVPGGLTCDYNGKTIPAFVTNSKSGGYYIGNFSGSVRAS